MKSLFIFLLLILICASLASANLQVSPGKLEFNLGVGEKKCQSVVVSNIEDGGSVNARDEWTTDNAERNLNKFTFSSQDLGIGISYEKQFQANSGSKGVEVCIQSSNPGDKTGALIFRPESTTNVIIESGVWLVVHVSGTQTQSSNTQTSGSGNPEKTVASDPRFEELKSDVNGAENNEPTKDDFDPLASPPVDGGRTEPTVKVGVVKSSLFIYLAGVIVIFIVVFVIATFIQKKREARNPWRGLQN